MHKHFFSVFQLIHTSWHEHFGVHDHWWWDLGVSHYPRDKGWLQNLEESINPTCAPNSRFIIQQRNWLQLGWKLLVKKDKNVCIKVSFCCMTMSLYVWQTWKKNDSNDMAGMFYCIHHRVLTLFLHIIICFGSTTNNT